MIAFHLLQLMANNGLGVAGTDLFYGEAPYEQGTGVEAIWIEERGNGDIQKNGCITEEFDIYVRDCSATNAHKRLLDVFRFFQCSRCQCIQLPEVTSACCADPDAFNQMDYMLTLIRPIGTYEKLGQRCSGQMAWTVAV